MNREILFRGKRVDNGEWVEGTPYAEHIICGMTTAYYDDEVPMSKYSEFDYLEVDPSTIGQYTGLTDKNGKKIFEHDVISVLFEADRMPENIPEIWAELFEVVFSDEYHAWFTKCSDGEIGEWMYEYDGGCRVIGNIFDNPTLLEANP
jgi:uncharacterized phage protein (TIGR01671 family)